MTKVYKLDNILVTDVQALDTSAIDGRDVQVVQEDGYGQPNPFNPSSDLKVPAIRWIGLTAVAGDIVAIVHPSHIIQDNERLAFVRGLLEEGVMVACLTTGTVYGSGQKMPKQEAIEAYTSYNLGALAVQKSAFRLL